MRVMGVYHLALYGGMTKTGYGPAYDKEYEAPWHQVGGYEHKCGRDNKKEEKGGR